MWWAMKLARGEKSVTSLPRWSMSRSWLASMVSRMSSSLMKSSSGRGALTGSPTAATWRSRHAPSWGGAVV